ncbi:MAG: plasmid mobilization relaxosome protein MobC [Peptococcaceae bacterium]|nr:plasmid mobilization relaxosome protein MobC [Peptococcaceae bacterium]
MYEMRNRNISVLIRLNQTEYDYLKKQVAASGLSQEAYLRLLIAGYEIKPKPPEEYKALLRELSAIGNNVNQIAKVANSKGFIAENELEDLKKLQDTIWQKVKGL